MTPCWAAIHCCSRASKPSTSSYANSKRNVESDGGLAMWVPSSSLSVLRWRFAKRTIPSSEPWLLSMARIANSSIHHCGRRIPRLTQQSGNALRKLIGSVAAAGFPSGDAKRFGRDLRIKPELNSVRQAYWDTLQIGLGRGPATSMGAMDSVLYFSKRNQVVSALGQ